MTTTTQTTELSLSHEETETVEPMELTMRLDSAPATNCFKPSQQTNTCPIDVTHSVGEYHTEASGKDDSRQLSKKRRGPDFRCPYFAANPETCQDAKCKSWHNPCIAAVTRHALRDSNKNDATGRQSRAIKSLSHRKLSAEDRWKHYYGIHGGTDAHGQSQPYWPKSAKGDKTSLQTGQHVPDAEFLSLSSKAELAAVLRRSTGTPLTDSRNHIHRNDCDTFAAASQSGCQSLDIRSSDDFSQALLELIARKEARDDAIDTAIEEKGAKKMAALRSEIAQEKLAEKSKNQNEFVAGLKKIIMHSQSGNMPFSATAGSYYQQVDKARSENGI